MPREISAYVSERILEELMLSLLIEVDKVAIFPLSFMEIENNFIIIAKMDVAAGIEPKHMAAFAILNLAIINYIVRWEIEAPEETTDCVDNTSIAKISTMKLRRKQNFQERITDVIVSYHRGGKNLQYLVGNVPYVADAQKGFDIIYLSSKINYIALSANLKYSRFRAD